MNPASSPGEREEGRRGAPDTLMEVLGAAAAWLARRGLEKPRLEAEVLLARVLGVDRLRLYLEFDRPLSEAEKAGFRKLLEERARGTPSAYLTGEKEFHSLSFLVDRRVLIPRPETETLLEAALEAAGEREEGVLADAGTGSGCLVVSFLAEKIRWRGFATDLSRPALEVARANAARHGVEERVEFLEGDLLAPLEGKVPAGGIALVVANPPYVEEGDPELDRHVARFEPPQALFPGPGGVEPLWLRLRDQAARLLEGRGRIFLECAPSQAEGLAGIFRSHPAWEGVEIRRDLAGRPRVVGAQRRADST